MPTTTLVIMFKSPINKTHVQTIHKIIFFGINSKKNKNDNETHQWNFFVEIMKTLIITYKVSDD